MFEQVKSAHRVILLVGDLRDLDKLKLAQNKVGGKTRVTYAMYLFSSSVVSEGSGEGEI